MKKLWEVDHRYYCNNGNYYSNDPHAKYDSWQEFYDENNDECQDMNLIFRWDWEEKDQDGDSNYTGDPNYRNGILYLYYMGQRKGIYRFVEIKVCRNNEESIREFLQKRYEVIKEIWEPIK